MFKVGDKVRIKNDISSIPNVCDVMTSMKVFCDTEAIITGKTAAGNFQLNIPTMYVWHPSWLEPISRNYEINKHFK